MNTDRLRAINALTALVRAHDLGIDARKPLTTSQNQDHCEIAGTR